MSKHNAKPSETALIESFRKAIADSGMSFGEIQEASGVSAGMLSRFMRDERGLNLQTASKLASVLGYKLVKCDDATVLQKKSTKGKDKQ